MRKIISLILMLYCATISLANLSPFGFHKILKAKAGQLKNREVTNRNIVVGELTQRIDNFDPTNHNTYQQTFYSNNEHYITGGPIFIHLGGLDPYAGLEYGLWYDIAEDAGAYMFAPEHRYFGSSFPVDDASTENLRYLTIEQMVADTAHFIEYILSTYPYTNQSAVIATGSLYGGTMATFLRSKYPHLVDGVWASSSPLLARVNNFQFNEVVGAAYLSEGGSACYDVIEEAFEEMNYLVDEGDIDDVERVFAICPHDNDNEQDVRLLFNFIAEILGEIVTFAEPGTIDDICEFIIEESVPSPMYGVASIVKNILAEAGCIPLDYEELVDFESEIELDSIGVMYGVRQQTYLQCLQIGWFHSSDSRFQPFGSRFPVDVFHQFCIDVFGDFFNNETVIENSNRLNTIFGGLDQEFVTNVIYTHGMNDPWRVLGIQTDQNERSEVEIIRGYGHAFDTRSIGPSDNVQVLALKRRIEQLIDRWTAESADNSVEEQ